MKTTNPAAAHTPMPTGLKALASIQRDVRALCGNALANEMLDAIGHANNRYDTLEASNADLLAALEASFAALHQARVFIADNLTTRAASDELVASWDAQNQARDAIAKAKGQS